MRNKISIVTDTYLPFLGGAEIHVKNLAKFLQGNNDVEIFTNAPGEESVDGIKVVRNKKINKFFRLFCDTKSLYLFIKKADIVHGHYTFYLSFLSSIIARLLRKPFVVTLHGLGTLDSSVDKHWVRNVFRYVSLKLSSAVIATSDEMAEVATRFVPKHKIHIITNGVDTNYFKPTHIEKQTNKFVVFSVRRLNPKNGVQYLIEAIPEIVKECQDAEFWITGKDKLEEKLKERVKELGVEKNVRFIGMIPNENLIGYFNDADVVVFPSSAESTSIACLESMSMEKAIVASALSAYKTMLGNDERGLMVKLFDREFSDYNAPSKLPSDKIKLLSDSIIRLYNDKELKNELGKKARKYAVENFDWRVLIRRLELIYKDLIK